MQAYQFFEEFKNPSRLHSAGNVIAIQIGCGMFVKDGEIFLRAVCAEEEWTTPNSPVVSTLFSAEYLGTHCRHVSEARARAIHPKLFEYLDNLA